MFTLKQIQEIAAKLAQTAVKDSQFEEIDYPLNSTESVPILQDGANKRVPFAEFVNIIVGNEGEAHLNIPCSLNVYCNTSGATIKIGGLVRQNNQYTGHYGEIVLVEITKQGYDEYYESVTLTNNTSLSVTLNPSAKDYDEDLDTIRDSISNLRNEIMTILNTMSITYVNDTDGSYYVIQIGENSVKIYSKEQIDEKFASGGGQSTVDPYAPPYLYFDPSDDIDFEAEGGTLRNVSLKSNLDSWVITAKELPNEEQDQQQQEPTRGNGVGFGPEIGEVEEGKTGQIYETN